MATQKTYRCGNKANISINKRIIQFTQRVGHSLPSYTTSDPELQDAIESHSWYKSGSIWKVGEVEIKDATPVVKPGTPESETPAAETGAKSDINTDTGSDEGAGDAGTDESSKETGADSNEGAGDAGTDETPTNQTIVNNQGQDEELLAVTSTQKAIVYLTGKGFDAAAIGKDKQAVIDFAATKNITFPNWK